MERRSSRSGYFMFVSAMLIYGSVGVFRKFIPLSSAALAFSRGLIGGIFLLCWMCFTGKSIKLNIGRKKFLLLCLTGVALGANWLLLFEAYNYTSVAVATLCYYMEPTILILLSPLLFQEKLTLKKSICAIVSLFGMALVSGVFDGSSDTGLAGILLGLGAAVLYATVIVLNKKNQVENTGGKTVVQLLSAAVMLIPYLLFTEKPDTYSLDWTAGGLILVVCIVHTGVAYAMYFGSVRKLPAQTVAVLSYIDPIVALVLGAVLLKEPMSASQLLGGVLILSATAVSELSAHKS